MPNFPVTQVIYSNKTLSGFETGHFSVAAPSKEAAKREARSVAAKFNKNHTAVKMVILKVG